MLEYGLMELGRSLGGTGLRGSARRAGTQDYCVYTGLLPSRGQQVNQEVTEPSKVTALGTVGRRAIGVHMHRKLEGHSNKFRNVATP